MDNDDLVENAGPTGLKVVVNADIDNPQMGMNMTTDDENPMVDKMMSNSHK